MDVHARVAMQHTPAQHQSASGAPQTTAAAPLAAAAAASASGGTTRRNGGSSGKRRKSDITATTSGLPSAGDSVPPQSSDSSGEEGADPAAGGHQHTRSRSKRLSRGATQAQSSFSGMEVMTVKLSHGRQSAVLADISNQPTISQTTTRRQKSLAQQPQIVPEKLSLAHSRRRTTRTSGNGVALSVIPSPPASHGHDADRDCAMELAAPPSALTLDDDDGAAALNTSLDSNSSIHSFQSGLKDLRIQCEDVSMHADHSHQLDNTAASSSTIDSAGSAHTSFSVAFAAAHAHADGDSNGASLNSSFMSQGDCLESAFRPTRPSSTPEILTTAASTLTHSMTHSLQLEPNTAAAAPAAAGEAASAACLHPLVTLPSAPTLTVPSHSHATLAGVAPSNSSASAHGWAAHLLGASSVGGPSVPVSASVPLLEYSEEIWSHLLSVETKHLANPAYMDQVQSDLSYVMRSILMDWLIEVAEEYTLCSQTLFLCVNYVDRFLSVYPVDRAKLQLLGVACLLLASKYWEVRAPTVDDFIYISDATYSREQILTMESALLNTLEFTLTVVTPWDCSTRISSKMGRELMPQRTEHLAELMMELFILEPHYLAYRPCVIAASALFLALYNTYANPWPVELESACQLTVDDVQLCVRAMHAAYLRMTPNGIIPSSGAPPLVALRDKYSQAKFDQVADIQPRLL